MLNFSGQILLSSKEKLKDPFVAIEKLPKKSFFILRDEENVKYDDSYIKSIQSFCKKRGVLFFVQNITYAKKFKADGISFKEKDKFTHINKDLVGDLIIGQSCHDEISAKFAERIGRDFILYSPLFRTTSHKGVKPLGVIKFSRDIRDVNIPVIALGGINKKNISLLKTLKIAGFAAIDYYLSDE